MFREPVPDQIPFYFDQTLKRVRRPQTFQPRIVYTLDCVFWEASIKVILILTYSEIFVQPEWLEAAPEISNLIGAKFGNLGVGQSQQFILSPPTLLPLERAQSLINSGEALPVAQFELRKPSQKGLIHVWAWPVQMQKGSS